MIVIFSFSNADGYNSTSKSKEVTYKIEEYEDKRIIKVKACKNKIENLPQEDEED